jgi:glycosyltransferase involved in cell wall biosynthesis
MRIAFVWPWFHNLAHNYATLLEELGHQTLVFTTTKHWDPVEKSKRNIIVDQFKPLSLFQQSREIFSQLEDFAPDLIFFEESLDPRFMNLVYRSKVPYTFSIHDPKPHDLQDQKPLLRDLVGMAQRRASAGDLTFSRASQSIINSKFLVSLVPELPLEFIPPPIVTSRNHYVTFGRIRPYKNLDWLVKVWPDVHKSLRGQELHIYGKSDQTFEAPGVKHFNRSFGRDYLMRILPTYRAAIFPHTNVSQSGTLLLSHAASLSSVTTAELGFVEFQPKCSDFMQKLDEKQLIDILARRIFEKSDNDRGQEARLHLTKLINDSRNDLEALIATNF